MSSVRMPHLAIAALLALLLVVAGAGSARAATYTVTANGDAVPDGCTPGDCTLREAIEAANAAAGTDTIDFAEAVSLVDVGTSLPAVTGTAVIDATSHAYYSTGYPAVTLDGSGLESGDGLQLTGTLSQVRGLRIQGFPGAGIRLQGSGGHVVRADVITGNTGGGVVIASAGNIVGGTGIDEPNEITGNYADGVFVSSGTGNAIRANAIDGNDGLGVDLGADGVTANDAGDGDTGANDLQNFPVLSTATGSTASVTVQGTLSSKPSTSYTVDVYVSDFCDPSGNGEGATFVGTATVPANGSGTAIIDATFDGDYTGRVLTATATDPSGNTSEFSACVHGPDVPPPDPTSSQRLIQSSGPLYGIYLDNNLACQVLHTGDREPEFYSGTDPGACGTFLATGGTVYGPNNIPAGNNNRTEYALVSQSTVSGSGSQADPYRVITVVDAGTTGLRLTRTDTYVVGQETYRSDLKVDNSGGAAATATLYHAADCYLQDSDYGYGFYDAATGGIYCTRTANNSPVARIEGFVPLSSGSSHFEESYSTVWSAIVGAGTQLANTCACTSEIDNGMGLSWALSVPAGGSVTRSWVTAFSPAGVIPDTTPPAVTLVDPADDATTGATPTYDGAAGTDDGDLGTITVKIYSGSSVDEANLVQTLTTSASGAAWTVDGSSALTTGTYTAQAQQSDASGNTGYSDAHTFTVGQPALSVDDVTVTEGDSGTTNATFTVSLDMPAPGAVSVHYATADGTATQPADYTQSSGDLSWSAGQTTKTVDVPVVGDTADEDDETFTLQLSSATGATIGDDSGTGTIRDDDALIDIADAGAAEGAEASFTVTLGSASQHDVTVNYATAEGSAKAADFTATSGTLTFTAGETSKSIAVPTTNDALDEDDETFTVTLSAPAGAKLGDAEATGTIADDDPTPSLAIADGSVIEGTGAGTTTATLTVTLSAASGRSVSVNYASVDGTALQPTDYAGASGTLTFTPGQTSKTVSVDIVRDSVDETDEQLTVVLDTPANATLGDASGTLAIDDDDGPAISVGDATLAAEGNAGSKPLDFTVSLSASSPQTVSVHFATADGSAKAGLDYTATSGTLTFAPGQTSKTVSVPVTGDVLDESDETFTLGLSLPVDATIADASGTGTIVDDDDAPSVSVNDVTVAEGNAGTTNAVFTVALSAPSGKSTSVQYATADGTATAGSDYGAATGTLTFAPGEVSKTVTVAVTGDTAVEPDETYTVALSAPVNLTLGDASGTGTITNDDSPPPEPVVPSVSVSDATVSPEGNSGSTAATFSVTLSAASTGTVTVAYATAHGTATAPADYAATSGTLTFSPGQTSKTVTVDVKGDTLVESNETFALRLSSPAGATLGDAEGTGTIVDDDAGAGDIDLPGKADAKGLFCGAQGRGRCVGIAVKGVFDRPGDATWVFSAYNPGPGTSSLHAGARVTLGKVTKKIAKAGKVSFRFKLKPGAKTAKLLKTVRKRRLSNLEVRLTFASKDGRRSVTTATMKLKR